MTAQNVRVLQLCGFASPYKGSFVPSLEALGRAVAARGWRCEAVFAPGAQEHPWYAELRDAGMGVRVCSPVPRRARRRKVSALLAEQDGPAILHTHFASWDLPAVAAARSRHSANRVAVIWQRHGMLSRHPLVLARNVAKFAIAGRAVDAHLCVGPGSYAQLLARGAPAQRTHFFPNAIDVDRFEVAREDERLQARRELGIDAAAKVLAGFMWEWERKGGPLMLELVRELGTRGREVIALLVGAGHEAEVGASRIGVERRIQLAEPRSNPRAFFDAADVFVAPSLAEGLAYSPLESVCCGTPVVASDIPGHRHFGAHLPALRLTPLSAIAMADAVEAELDAPASDRADRITASRAHLAQHAGLDQWAERLVEVYADVIAPHSSPRPV